jgi:hypothetical protein
LTGLSATQRGRLERLVLDGRALLEDDLGEQLAGQFGIDPDGRVADGGELRLAAGQRADRDEVVAVLCHLRSEGETPGTAVARLLREAVFTHLNRLVAIRIAESLSLIRPALSDGRASAGFRDTLELAPLLADDPTGGYWAFLQLCGDELAADMPVLFDPRNPLLCLRPSPKAVEELTALFSEAGTADLWAADDTLGWVYQFFNRKEERDAMRLASSAPRTSRELAVRNQFFTPRYVVDFLVQNSLGRRLVAGDPTGRLVELLPLLTDPPAFSGEALPLEHVSVLDPAVGSGHFLLGAYELLELAWQVRGVSPADAAPAIVTSLWGIDIDARAAQVAAAAIMLRARRSCPRGALPRPNVVTARALPPIPDDLPTALGLTAEQTRTLRAVATSMAGAPILGSLRRVEAEIESALESSVFAPARAHQDVLSITTDRYAADEAALLAALSQLAKASEATVGERLFAAETDDALRFVEAMRQQYDAVLMNPPFGEPVPSTKDYLRAAYPWAPARVDLLAVFVGRGLELCKPGGYLGAITNRAGLFTSTFEKWRRQVLLANGLTALADLGFGVMEQAMVEAAAYVVRKGPAAAGEQATFFRLLRDRDRADALADVVHRHRADSPDERIYRVGLSELAQVPGAPFAYAMSPAIRALFAHLPALQASASVVVGLQTGDDGQFVRAFWEVDPRRIARSVAETNTKRWVPFAKGGEYAPYWSDIHLVVDYQYEGKDLRDFDGSAVRNPQFYFRPGLTWPRRTNSALSVRVLPAGCAFADKGPSIFPHADEGLALLAWLNSRYVRLLIDLTAASGEETRTGGVPSRSYEVGILRSLPDPTGGDEDRQARLANLAAQAASGVARGDENDETTRRFRRPAVLDVPGSTLAERAAAAVRRDLERATEVIAAHDAIERLLDAALAPDGSAEEALYDADGPLVSELPDRAADPALLGVPVARVVEAATAAHGIARWIGLSHHTIDRRLELAAISEQASPAALLRRLPTDHLPAEEPRRAAYDLFSYLLGAALGRWDVRVGAAPEQEGAPLPLFDPVQLCPPGQLVDSDGFPMVAPPLDYPLALPDAALLLDQPGHRWDVLELLRAAADAVLGDGEFWLQELQAALGRDLRDELRTKFFAAHATRYSKSRRKAPLYWPAYVPSGQWGAWLFAPRLTRETLFALAGFGRDRLAAAEQEIRRLQRERETGGSRSPRELTGALEAEQRLTEELRVFAAEAERIASLGWEPDLDDGLLLCAAPLADLLAWDEATAARDELRAGRHSWASVARWADRL